MPLETQEIDNLLGGVSQKPVTERDANQVEEEINGILTIAKGNGKRPPSQHTAVLSAVPTAAYDAVHTHLVSRSSTDRYRVILSNGDLKVFDAVTGTEQTVEFPNGKTYLNTADPARDFRCVTIGDYTYITNGSVNVLRGTAASPVAVNEALISVRQGDYNTNFSVTIDGVGVTYTTPDGSTPSTMRDDLASDKIAEQLKLLIDANTSLAYLDDCVQYGSTLYIKRTDGADFAIAATDGLSDETIIAIKSTVQSFDLLPEKAKHGFIVEVLGDPTNEFDNYFVKYDSSLIRNRSGVWKETVKPGILTTLDASTMPHQLVRGDIQYQGVESKEVPPAAEVFVISTLIKDVYYEASAIYPAGYTSILQLGASPAIQQLSAVDQTGAQVATAMIALVNATGSYTATATGIPGYIRIQSNPAGIAISASTSFTWNTAVKVYVPDVTLTVNALIGSKVNNTSDGSSGTITANTAHTITVGALTGGGTNKFLKGDFIDIVSATTNYVFKEALWKPRKVGSMETAPFPSFVGKKVSELFYAKSRLGFVSENRIVTSRTSDYLNLFRESAAQLLPSDPVDVISATQAKANFHSAVHWNEVLMLWSSQGQYVFDGEPQLTPETVSIVQKSEYINSTRLRPVSAGNKIYFARGKGKSTQVLEYELVETGDRKADASDITKHIPTYIAGTPIQMAVDPSLGILALLTDADQSKLYVYSYHYEDETLVQSAWDRWEFAAGTRIVSIDIQDGKLGLVVSRPGGVYLETIDLDPAADSSSILAVRSLDRRIKGDAPGLVSSFVAGVVSWTLPCSIAVDGSEGTLVVARISTGQIVPSTRSGPTNVTVTGLGDIRSDCYIGVLYTWRIKLSTIMKRAVNRDGREVVVTAGRLILRYLTAKFHDTTDLVGTVTLSGRTPVSKTYRNAAPTVPSQLRFPVQSKNTNAVIELSDTSPGSVYIDGLSWEGNHEKSARTL